MRKHLAAVAVMLAAAATPAGATEWLICSDGGKALMSVLLGNMQVIAVDTIRIEVGKKNWSTRAGEGTPITKGQAFETASQMLIDATDAANDAIVAELRLFKASEGEDDVAGGTLRVAGEGAWAVTCEGP